MTADAEILAWAHENPDAAEALLKGEAAVVPLVIPVFIPFLQHNEDTYGELNVGVMSYRLDKPHVRKD